MLRLSIFFIEKYICIPLAYTDIMLKSKNKDTNSGCNSTKIFKTTRNAAKYMLTLYMTHK